MIYQDLHNTLYNLNFLDNDLPDESVQMVCTSPPYWGLRKYSGEQELIWGGEKDCEHEWVEGHPAGYRSSDTNPGKLQSIATQNRNQLTSNTCSLCGAWRGAYGLEPDPESYVRHTIEYLREIRRVLRKDGCVFWNIGDSYATTPTGSYGTKSGLHGAQTSEKYKKTINEVYTKRFDTIKSGLKPKDLCLIPFRVAIAAQEDGWWVRSVIIWSKNNPMPESVTDRPTESHEYILMLTKSARYYWDADAVREPQLPQSMERAKYVVNKFGGQPETGASLGKGLKGGNPGTMVELNPSGRNIRSVWEFPTQPYPEAHFAVFPEKLPELCIKAATPEVGCCSKCGAPWERIVESKQYQRHDTEPHDLATDGDGANRGKHSRPTERETLGWQPTCECNADKVPSVVLDPFSGAGTTLWVAKKLNRRAIGFEISEEYCQLSVERIRQQVMF